MKADIIKIYEQYGFSLQKEYNEDGVLVFLLKAGYFRNADIVPIKKDFSKDKAFKEFTDLGYACTSREFLDPESIEKQLFEGFFSIDSTREKLNSDYIKFTKSIVEPFGNQTQYKYLNAPYVIDIKSDLESPDLVEEIVSRINIKKPILFLVEAAAGFGKTCSAYELASKINKMENKIPLFSELSKNRQARIFRHILLDEIDRTFPLLSSTLVKSEILNGRVITILDGFDELLRDNEAEGDFDNKEPMLETIGEYLRGEAKIILTTRRTILFEGDDFHRWVEKNESEFSLVKIRINEPNIKDWIEPDRLEILNNSQVDLINIANPVLLSFLRCINDDYFKRISREPEKIVDSYFEFMLDREKTRQELMLDTNGQNIILESIAMDMIKYGYKSEERDYIVSHILENNLSILDKSIANYPSTSRPSREELANKLASHALLDRSTREPNKIGFVNEFVLGNYVANNIIKFKGDWLYDDWGFTEAATLSYKPRSNEARHNLFTKISYLTEFLNQTNKASVYLNLKRNLDLQLENGEIESISINEITLGERPIITFQFNSCAFINCRFNISNFIDVTFLNCKFYNCKLTTEKTGGDIHLLGSEGDQEFIERFKAISQKNIPETNIDENNQYSTAEKLILEKFWPIGRETITYKHRPIKGIITRNGSVSPEQLYTAIDSLKKKKLLLEPRSPSFVEINFELINEIKTILGR